LDFSRKLDSRKRAEILKSILIIGANSAIAKATARHYAQQKDALFLLARDTEQLALQKADLILRGATNVDCAPFEAMDFASHEALVATALETLGHFDIVLISHGCLPDQALCESDFDAALEAFNVNALSVVSLLNYIAKPMQERRDGCIAVVTSVAGDRGRQSNYIYGSAKALVSTYLQGLRGRLFPFNISVMDIKPGFVDSPMTAHLPKGALWAQPEKVAQYIIRGIEKNRGTVYAPSFWRLIMLVVRSVPEVIFKRLKL
jgi:decaprenylphospho-beta-D-erythro-pentofuranosid-2-ulose 2-reductase